MPHKSADKSSRSRHNGAIADYTMLSRRFAPIVWIVCAVALTLVAVLPFISPGAFARSAQNSQDAQPQRSQQPIHIEVNLVNLFATVRDKKSKQIVSTLEQNDFTVSEDGAPQKISFFSKDSK